MRWIDNFYCACTCKQIAEDIYSINGTKIQFQLECNKNDIPLEYLGLATDHNGTDIVQTNQYNIKTNYSNYNINFFLMSYGWDVASIQADTAPTYIYDPHQRPDVKPHCCTNGSQYTKFANVAAATATASVQVTGAINDLAKIN